MKSNVTSNSRSPNRMGVGVSPRGVRERGTCHQWLRRGDSFSLIFPMICVHMWSVSRVSFHASSGNAGHASASTCTSDLLYGLGCGTMRIYGLGAFQPCGYVVLASSSDTD